MLFSVDLKIPVPLEIIRQEAHTALEGHHLGSHRKQFDLPVRKPSSASFYEAFGIQIKQLHITGHFRQIPLVLCRRTCAETDRIPEVIHGKPRHNRIQIDHADSFPRLIIDHNIVKLRIIMCYTDRQLSLRLEVPEIIRNLLSVQNKLDLISHGSRPLHHILFHCLLEYRESRLSIMKPFDRLIERLSRIIRQHTLEIPERQRALIEMLRLLHHIIAGSIRDELIGTPVITVRITVIRFVIVGRDHIQRLPLRISAVLDDLFPQKCSDTHHILHQLLRLPKDVLIHLLQDDLDASHAGDLECQKICVIDMSISIGTSSHKPSVILKISNYLCNLNR